MNMFQAFSRREVAMLGAACAALLLAVFGPQAEHHTHYHAFADQPVFELTQYLVSGHSLKHIVAAFAAWPVIRFMHNRPEKSALKKRARAESRQVVRMNQSQNTF